jgi:hypothetical protein
MIFLLKILNCFIAKIKYNQNRLPQKDPVITIRFKIKLIFFKQSFRFIYCKLCDNENLKFFIDWPQNF